MQRRDLPREKLQKARIELWAQSERLALLFVWITVSAALLCTPLQAQVSMGGIAGIVKDPTGAIVKGAQIALTNQATQVLQTTQSTST